MFLKASGGCQPPVLSNRYELSQHATWGGLSSVWAAFAFEKWGGLDQSESLGSGYHRDTEFTELQDKRLMI